MKSDTERQNGYFARVIDEKGGAGTLSLTADDLRAMVKSALVKVMPGRQKARNFDAYVTTGCKEAARTARRRVVQRL